MQKPARTFFYAHYSISQELLEKIENRTIGKMRQYTKQVAADPLDSPESLNFSSN